MENERMRILQMVETNQITVEQANELLDALSASEEESRSRSRFTMRGEQTGSSGAQPPTDEMLRKLTEARIHGVDAAYARKMAEAGLTDLSLDELIEARIHGLNPDKVREIKSWANIDLSFKQLCELSMFGVSPEYIREMQELGFVQQRDSQPAQER